MNYIEAMKIQRRMLGVTGNDKDSFCNAECCTCLFHKEQTKKDVTCEEFPLLYPDLAEKILEEWNEKNPPKTRIEVFMEKFPMSHKQEIIDYFCCNHIWGNINCTENNYGWTDCNDCWNEAVE